MAKINRTIKFLISIGIIIYVDTIIDITLFFNKLIQAIIYIVFNLRTDNIDIYTSLYASIAVLLSSNITITKKFEYSIWTFLVYVTIFTFITAYRIMYPFPYYAFLNLMLTLIVFITMTFPILLWIILDEKRTENSKKIIKEKIGHRHIKSRYSKSYLKLCYYIAIIVKYNTYIV